MAIYNEVVLLIILLALSAFFSGSEAALLSISRFKVRYMVEKKRPGAVYIKKLKDNPERLLSTILIGSNLVTTAAAAITTSISIEIFRDKGIGIAIGAATFLILVFGDITPKSIGTNNNERITPIVAPPIWFLSVAISPLIKLLDYFLKGINKLIGAKKIPIITEEELMMIVKAGEEEGTIKEIENKMIHRIFDFDNTSVSDVMTTKKNMAMVSSETQISDVLKFPTAKRYSRLPVYERHKDNIIGILYLKDMLRLLKDGKLDVKAGHIARKPFFVFEDKKIDKMLRLFQSRKEHMAIVIDKKANVVGLVTIENILEEIVGEIIDESDKINPSISQISKNEWAVKGSAEIEEINSRTGASINASDYIDLDNFIFAMLGRAPRIGDRIAHKDFDLIMDDVQGRKVLRARIVKGRD